MRVRLSKGICDEYEARLVFGGFDGWPYVPPTAGTYEIDRSTVEAMLSDAQHFFGADAPDEMLKGEARIYRAHADRCRKALAGAV
jgi:hypothetical protein